MTESQDTRPTSSRTATARAKAVSGSAPVLMGLLTGAVGLAIVAVSVTNQNQDNLSTARPDELVRVLQQLNDEERALESQIRKLEATLAKIQSGSSAQAYAEAKARADALSILAGTVPVKGPGVEITIKNTGESLSSSVLLDAVQELRDAGAESIAINDKRVVVNTWFGDQAGGVVVSGEPVGTVWRLRAIGDPATMETAMNIPGGVVGKVTTEGGSIDIVQKDQLVIEPTVPQERPPYVEPAS